MIIFNRILVICLKTVFDKTRQLLFVIFQVALWKFSADATSGDTRPLLCFSADTVPIRAAAWPHRRVVAAVGGETVVEIEVNGTFVAIVALAGLAYLENLSGFEAVEEEVFVVATVLVAVQIISTHSISHWQSENS
ncbi:hypothetical protein M5689_011846 [Euphorbia peplus]|nr:hypothetical protein M5689_011846 [Euphorbia peplus]